MFFGIESRTTSTLTRLFLALFAAHTALACSATNNPESETNHSGANESDGGLGGSGAGEGSGSSGAAGNDDVHFDVGDGGTPLDEESACVTTSSTASAVELDLIVLLDRSGSMYGQNWNGATTALKQFVQDPSSAGVNVGIVYFPTDSPPDGLVCNDAHYQNLSVPLGKLPQNAPALVQSIDDEDPNGGSTPMYGALHGALAHATAQKDQFPSHKVILVFASDGDPNSCPGNQNDISEIAGLAKAALDYNGVETYVVAISGASVINLDKIAAAGGTTKAYDVTQNISQFSQRMGEIRANALACHYIVPEPPGGEPLEPGKVVVKHINADGTTGALPPVANKNACGQGDGWYYDDPINPHTIELCPASCNIIEEDHDGKVDVLFGCKPKLH